MSETTKQQIPLPDDIHHFSAIRIGNTWAYNGANGDAFSFTFNKPKVMTSAVSEPFLSSIDSKSKKPPSLPATHPSSVPASVASGSEHMSTPDSTPPSSPRRSLVLTRHTSSSSLVNSQSQRHSYPFSPLLMSQSPPRHPEAYGLPPVLPRPPAAHLPPPLPSRPASSVRSCTASSASSTTSSRRSSVTQEEKPLTVDTALADEEVNSAHESPSFFRSSGTIKVEASIKTFQRQKSLEAQRSPSSPRSSADMDSANEPPNNLPSTTLEKKAATPSKSSKTSLSMALSISAAFATTPVKISTVREVRLNSDQESGPPNAAVAEGSQKDSDTAYESASDDSGTEDAAGDDGDGYRGESLTPVGSGFFFPRWKRRNQKEEAEPTESNTQITEAHSKDINVKSKKSTKKSQGPIPPEFGSIRNRSMKVADVFMSALVVYKANKANKAAKSPPTTPKQKQKLKPKVVKAPKCRQCGKRFGFRHFRHHCSRCKGSFCDQCIPMEIYYGDSGEQKSALTRVCAECSIELAQENARGQTRGLWTEFERYRSEARDNRGLDVITSAKDRQQLEVQNLIDMVPRLRSVCMKFLVDLREELQRSQSQHRYNFITNYLQFENTGNVSNKYKGAKSKQCTKCQRQLRMLTEIHGCAVCSQAFCKLCTYRTLQLYLPMDTDVKRDITLESVRFHIKEDETDEVSDSEVTETYYMCTACEDIVARNLLILEFNTKIPDLEEDLFDLQRQIEHALSYGPHMQKSASLANLNSLDDKDLMATNIKIANKLYDRYMRAYDILDHLQPQTGGQKMLHKHIKQAMYDFYIKRRDQLKTTLRHRDS